MTRIPDKELETLKREVSIQRLAESRGVILRKRGEELMGLCPFHEDHSPSLVINPAKNLWHCLGACQSGGTSIDWVMKAEGCSFRKAVELLSRDYSPLAATAALSEKVSQISDLANQKTVVTRDGDTDEQIRNVLNYYTATLKESPEALAYLKKRGIDNADAIELFRLGYANRTLGQRIPSNNNAKGRRLRGQLLDAGIYRKSGHEHFNGSLVIPVTDEHGVVTEVYGRKISENLRKDTPRHLYLPGPHRGVWNIAALQSSKEIILCESLIDALTFWCAGYRNVTASYGIEGFTADHLDAFKRYGIERVFIAYDRDAGGDKAAASLAAKLQAEGIGCYRIQFPKGMDANEYALQVQPAEKSLGIVIEKAKWMGNGPDPQRSAANEKEDTPECRAGVNPPLSPAEADQSELNIDPGSEAEPTFPPLVANTECAEAATAPPSSLPEVKNGEVKIELGDRRWRIRGLDKNLSVSVMKVNLMVSRGDAFHIDTFDLYTARHRYAFIKQAADELCINEDVIKRDLGKLLMQLESLQEELITQTLESKKTPEVTLTEEEKAAAMELLTDPNLLDRILADFEKCGVLGEETNKLVGYLAAVSRKLERPLAIVIQSSSAAGKSALMEAILSFLPREEQVKYSAMTGQSLFYMGETDLKQKILAIVEEEGAEKAAYALKLLQSEGELMIASTGKDPVTGRLVTQEYRVEGPVMIFLTTTAIDIDEELLNRCIVLTVDESREQTRAIHRFQREMETIKGMAAAKKRKATLKLHQNAQRLLLPIGVNNPYAENLTFMDEQTQTRRDHIKYLTLIRAIALLYQHQRGKKRCPDTGNDYIEVTVDDIEVANRLAHQVLGRSLDELAPQTRRLLGLMDEMVTKRCAELEMERSDYRFTRREVREYTGTGNTRLKVHLHRLEELEYLIVHHGRRGQQFVYELVYDGEGRDGTPFLCGLLDVSKLSKREYDANLSPLNDNLSPLNENLSPPSRPQVAPKSPPSRPQVGQVSLNDSGEIKPVNGKTPKFTIQGQKKEPSCIVHHEPYIMPTMEAKGAE